mgnify:CR=1 FL=1
MVSDVRIGGSQERQLISQVVKDALELMYGNYILVATDGKLVGCTLNATSEEALLDMRELINRTIPTTLLKAKGDVGANVVPFK